MFLQHNIVHLAVTMSDFCNAPGLCVNSVQLVKFWEGNQILQMLWGIFSHEHQEPVLHPQYIRSVI